MKKKAFFAHYGDTTEDPKVAKHREKKLKQMAKGYKSRAHLFRDWIDKSNQE
jgi:hypothetical protein